MYVDTNIISPILQKICLAKVLVKDLENRMYLACACFCNITFFAFASSCAFVSSSSLSDDDDDGSGRLVLLPGVALLVGVIEVVGVIEALLAGTVGAFTACCNSAVFLRFRHACTACACCVAGFSALDISLDWLLLIDAFGVFSEPPLCSWSTFGFAFAFTAVFLFGSSTLSCNCSVAPDLLSCFSLFGGVVEVSSNTRLLCMALFSFGRFDTCSAFSWLAVSGPSFERAIARASSSVAGTVDVSSSSWAFFWPAKKRSI